MTTDTPEGKVHNLTVEQALAYLSGVLDAAPLPDDTRRVCKEVLSDLAVEIRRKAASEVPG